MYDVSVTQSFNTSSSMGRLTLNVLLGGRDLVSHPLPDQFALELGKGLWMPRSLPQHKLSSTTR